MGKKAMFFSDLTAEVMEESEAAKVRIRLPGNGGTVELDARPEELSELIAAGRRVKTRGRKPAAQVAA